VAATEASARSSSEETAPTGSSQSMGDVDPAGLRSGPLVLSRVWRPDAGRIVHRTASGRRDRRALQALQVMAIALPKGAT